MMFNKAGLLPATNPLRAPQIFTPKLMGGRSPPKSVIRSSIDPSPLLLKNDVLNDCTSAALGNSIRAYSALQDRAPIAITDDNALSFYEASCGYVPGNPNTDLGGDIPKVLHTATTQGYPTSYNKFTPICGVVDYTDYDAVRLTISEFGFAYVGVALAMADRNDGVLDTKTYGDQTPGSLFLHCVLLYDYDGIGDTNLVTVISYNQVRKATWRWVYSRLTECYGVAWRQIWSAKATNINDEDWNEFVALNGYCLKLGR